MDVIVPKLGYKNTPNDPKFFWKWIDGMPILVMSQSDDICWCGPPNIFVGLTNAVWVGRVSQSLFYRSVLVQIVVTLFVSSDIDPDEWFVRADFNFNLYLFFSL